MRLFPTKQQWSSWSLPSRLTMVGCYAGTISLLLGCVFFLLSHNMKPVRNQKRTAIVPLVEAEDVHLGDNVFPERWGHSHNPLNIAVYPQPARGLVFFDKENGEFLAGQDNQTQIGQAFVSAYRDFLKGMDFTAYKYVSAYHEGQGPAPDDLKKLLELSHETVVKLGPTLLYVNTDNQGNFYERYAAVGIIRSLDFAIPLAKAGIEFKQGAVGDVEFLIECYHGGIRPEQPQNFALFLNGKSHEIRTTSYNMREKEVICVPIPLEDLRFRQENIAGIYVLPWQEAAPKSPTTGKGPVHFRDVGVVNGYFKVIEK
jgi:hypothetical protein